MKKFLYLIMPIGIVLLLFIFFQGSERAYGATKSASIGVVEPNGTEQVGPPWFDEAWHYRRPITISSTGSTLPYYQVLVKLNNSNFNFERANVNGFDIRFTHSDGTTELKYWSESWDKPNKKAYIWVRVPSLASGDTTIYLYYNNPAATSFSDGTNTFDGFDDDWSHFTTAGFTQVEDGQSPDSNNNIEALFTWSNISGMPVVSPGILNLADGTGIKSTTTYQYQAVGFKGKFNTGTGHVGTGHEWVGFNNGDLGKGTMIGDLPSDGSNLFLINYYSSESDTLLPRIGGIDWHNTFHVYEVRWKSGWSEGDIDHGDINVSSTSQVPISPPQLPVTLYNYPGSNATLMVDWIYVRQYRNPEPTSVVGAEQGLVDLGMSMVDSPDPVNKSTELTYLLTISNNSSVEAPGIIVTDTLPGSVQLVSGKTSPECSQVGSEIVCSLNTIPAYLTSNVTIVVKPTADGVITNSAIVGSLGYDLDMSNNVGEVTTLVDSIPPNVNWEKPVHNGEKYTTYGGLIALEASATDNDQVAWVEFWLWDHLPLADPKGKISIGIDTIYPYQMQFNSDILVPNQDYQVFVQAADRAGNVSDIYTTPYPRIYIERILLYFINIPIAVK
jgi:uncharacterized repeat protein (TIGR01451 family)